MALFFNWPIADDSNEKKVTLEDDYCWSSAIYMLGIRNCIE